MIVQPIANKVSLSTLVESKALVMAFNRKKDECDDQTFGSGM